MSYRFLLAFAGFIAIVGPGAIWLYYNILKKREFVQNLLSLPKERRFFWYKLRQSGFTVKSYNLFRSYSLTVNGNKKNYSLKADFLVRKNGKKYIGLFSGNLEEKEFLMLFFSYIRVFHAHGVIFYDENLRCSIVWEV